MSALEWRHNTMRQGRQTATCDGDRCFGTARWWLWMIGLPRGRYCLKCKRRMDEAWVEADQPYRSWVIASSNEQAAA